ncbi:MAG: hypothetical protein ND895_03640 [Pyrinomonadaceae bacterium]|nr:hypothetical protein [Pyrinomonadaceae bacterium]
MSKYRRIEIIAFRRRVTIVSGEEQREKPGAQPDHIDDSVSLTDTDSDETVALDSPEGQLILLEAVRSLEHRLSPEARAKICADQNPLASSRSNRNGFYPRLQSLYDRVRQKAPRFAR